MYIKLTHTCTCILPTYLTGLWHYIARNSDITYYLTETQTMPLPEVPVSIPVPVPVSIPAVVKEKVMVDVSTQYDVQCDDNPIASTPKKVTSEHPATLPMSPITPHRHNPADDELYHPSELSMEEAHEEEMEDGKPEQTPG